MAPDEPSAPRQTGSAARVAASVRRLRERQSLTQAALAEGAGLALRHLQKVEAGEVNLTVHTLDKLADALGVDVVELLAVQPKGGS